MQVIIIPILDSNDADGDGTHDSLARQLSELSGFHIGTNNDTDDTFMVFDMPNPAQYQPVPLHDHAVRYTPYDSTTTSIATRT